MQLIHAHLGVQKIKTLRAWTQLRHKMRIEVTLFHKQESDKDNRESYKKIPFDALKCLDCIVNDSPEWLESPEVQEVVGREVKTCFTITDLQSSAKTSTTTHREPTKRIMGRTNQLSSSRSVAYD